MSSPDRKMSDCETANDYDGRLSIRISAVFVLLAGSLFGALFSVYAAAGHQGA